MASVFPRNVMLSILKAKSPSTKLFSVVENTETLPQIMKAYENGRDSANARRMIRLLKFAAIMPRTAPYESVTRNAKLAIIKAPNT